VQRSQWLARLPRRLYTAAQVRELDRQAIEECGIPGIELMSRAAAALLLQVQTRWPQVRRLLVLAGSGNNAGDGYLLAALARAEGLRADVVEVGDVARLGPDAASARALRSGQRGDLRGHGLGERRVAGDKAGC
jgi:NAD(P)H-hydrate repair Nnr-like enzyme with NAD(P)H-hydrate epimerase domain